MKRLFAVVVVSMICFISSASYSAEYWAKTYGGSDYDRAYYIQQTDDGGYIVAGYVTEDTSKKSILVKLNSDGTVVWQRTYGEVDYFFSELIPHPERNIHIRPLSFQLTSDNCYILAYGTISSGAGGSDMLVQKITSSGDIVWQKTYGESGDDYAYAIKETSDGGYIIAGTIMGALALIKIDSSGNITWQKRHNSGGGMGLLPQSIHQIPDVGYIVAGNYCFCFAGDCHEFWVMQLDESGNVTWTKTGGHSFTYLNSVQPTSDGGCMVLSGFEYIDGSYNWLFKMSSSGEVTWQGFYAPYYYSSSTFQQTLDGGYVVGTSSLVFKLDGGGQIVWQKLCGGQINHLIETSDEEYVIAGARGGDMFILKLEHVGEIPYCGIISNASVTSSYIEMGFRDSSVSLEPLAAVAGIPIITPQDTSVDLSMVCCYDTEDQTDTDGDCLAGACDEFPETYDPSQPDTYPPQGNGIGDACDCEGDFDCNGGVDASDVTSFLNHFGRNQFNDPCTNDSPCDGDVNCDGNVDATDVTLFLEDFGRNQFNNPCPACEVGNWCEYTGTTTTIPSTSTIPDGSACSSFSDCGHVYCCCSTPGGQFCTPFDICNDPPTVYCVYP